MDKKLRLSIILEALDRVTGPMRGAVSQLDRAGRAFRATRDRVRDLGRAQRDMGAYNGLRERLVADTLALTQARQRADQLKTAYAQAEQPTAKLTRAFTRARDEVQRLERAQGEHRQGLRELETRLTAAGVDTRRLADEEVRLRRETEAATTELDRQRSALADLGREQRRVAEARAQYERTRQFASNLQSTGQSSVAAGMAMGAPIVLSGRQAVGLEAAMAEIRKVVDFETEAQFNAMRSGILDLSTRVPMTGAEIAAIIAEAGQANIPRAELMDFASDAAMMGVAFETTAEHAGDMMATWRTAFRMSRDQVRVLADQINYLGNNSAAGVIAVSEIVTRVGPLGEIGGLAADAIGALGATMVAVGVDEARAATGIQRMIVRLTAGAAATRQQQAAFRALGLESAQVARDMQADAAGTIMNVMRSIERVPEAERGALLKMLFGEQTISAIAPVLTSLDLLQTHLDMVGDASRYAGSMQLEFEDVNSTALSALNRARGGVAGMANEVGQHLLPLIKSASAWVIDLTNGLRAFAAAHPGVVKAVGGVLGTVSLALIVFGGLAMAVAAVLGPFALMRLTLILAAPMFAPVIAGALGAAKAFAAWGVAMLANPVTWIVLAIVAAVAALAAGAWLVVRNWGPISAWFGGLWNGIKAGAAAAIGFVVQTFLRFTPVGHLITAFAAVWRWLPSIRAQFLQFGGELIQGMIDGVLGGVGRLVAAVMRVGGRIIDGFKQRLGIRSPSRVFAGLGDDTVAGLALGLTRSAPSAIRAVARVGAGMGSALALGAADPAFAGANAPSGRGGAAGPVTINIYARPGQDARDIAREVLEVLEARAASRALSSYDDDGYGE